MGKLKYKKISTEKYKYTSKVYHVDSMYTHKKLQNEFINLRANVVDLNPALITKCIQGTEQDFIMLMNRAKDFLATTCKLNDAGKELLLDMFSECVFGYYILTPLIKDKYVSDIKVYSWNHITCKANGDRYVTDLSFQNEEDYNRWFDRITRIHRLSKTDDNALQHCTDRKGVENYFLRIDVELASIVSTEYNNIHIRKIPKEKYTWDYLKKEGMLDDEMVEYLEDRIVNGYSFLLSGKGGSGKTSLLNNMVDIIPWDESILISQESDELYSNVHPQMQIEHTLEVKRDGVKTVYSLEDELELGLLQDIDNFCIGEIKGGEALYVFTTAMSTGARFMGTIHSNNARSSTTRLAQCARFISDYPVETLLEMLTSTKFCLIHMTRFSIDEIVEIDGWDEQNSKLIFTQIYDKKMEIRNGK